MYEHIILMFFVFSIYTQSSKQEHPISGKEIQDLQKTMMTQFESVQETMVKNLVEKLGIEEDATLKDELSAVLSKEVRPLRESFKEVYSKVYMPQIEQQKVSTTYVLCMYVYIYIYIYIYMYVYQVR